MRGDPPDARLPEPVQSDEHAPVRPNFAREAVIIHQAGVIHGINRALTALLGYEPEEIIGQPCTMLAAPESRDRLLTVVQGGEAGGTGWLRMVRKDGTQVTIYAWSEPLGGQASALSAVIMVDLSDRAEPNPARLQAEECLELALLAADLAVWGYDPVADRTTWSPRAYAIFGLTEAEYQAGSAAFLGRLHPDDRERIDAAMMACIHGERTEYHGEYRIVRPDGAMRWVESRGRAFKGADGKVERVAGVLWDVTQRRELETQLLHSQRLEATGRLAGSVAHDFNNLLTIIMGHADLARLSVPLGAPGREALDQISYAAERASVLTRQLLIFARRGVAEAKVIDTNAAVRDAAGLLRRLMGPNVLLELQLPDSVWPIQIDPVQLEQLLVNLAVNARDAMPRGGTLRIHTGNVSQISATLGTPEEWVEITVRDEGAGMTEDVRARAFEPFFTTKALGQGTGLGLSTCKTIVERACGTIDVATTPGKGTTFSIRLPRSHERPAGTDVPAATELPRGSETVLLVEDDSAVRRLLRRVLRSLGYRVLEAGHGEEAYRRAEEHTGPIELIICDVVMPGASGLEVARNIRRLYPAARLLFVTGYAGDELARLGIEAAEVDVLNKPFSAEQLAHSVRHVLRAGTVSLPPPALRSRSEAD